MEEMNKTSDCVLKSLSTCGMPQIQAMAKELLELRAKAALEEKKVVPFRSTLTDKDLADFVEKHVGYISGVCRELLEYRKRTRRTHYQKGDVLDGTPGGYGYLQLVDSAADKLIEAGDGYTIYIPLDSLKDLHEV